MSVQQQSENFTQMVKRFKAVRNEKDAKEIELKKSYTEFEDALRQIDAAAQQ